MNVSISCFSNPFSFFLREKILESDNCDIQQMNDTEIFSKKMWADVNHGQYVAVWHGNRWTRGVISMESQVLIWLVDSGHYLRPADSTIYVNLPAEFKKLPTKVFEASIHGVVPIDKAWKYHFLGATTGEDCKGISYCFSGLGLQSNFFFGFNNKVIHTAGWLDKKQVLFLKVLSEECEIKDVVATTWNHGAIEKGQNTIKSSKAVYFVPLALMCTKGNDVVLGDLYLEIPGQGIVNFTDIMELWPVFLQKNAKGYIENLSTFYASRRKHHACLLKPVISNDELPEMSTTTSLSQYETIVSSAPKFELDEDSCSDDCSTIITKHRKASHLTADELEEYSQMYIKMNGTQHNVLNIIVNKCRDLSLCEKYKNKKSAGRATTRRSTFGNDKQLFSYSGYEDFD